MAGLFPFTTNSWRYLLPGINAHSRQGVRLNNLLLYCKDAVDQLWAKDLIRIAHDSVYPHCPTCRCTTQPEVPVRSFCEDDILNLRVVNIRCEPGANAALAARINAANAAPELEPPFDRSTTDDEAAPTVALASLEPEPCKPVFSETPNRIVKYRPDTSPAQQSNKPATADRASPSAEPSRRAEESDVKRTGEYRNRTRWNSPKPRRSRDISRWRARSRSSSRERSRKRRHGKKSRDRTRSPSRGRRVSRRDCTPARRFRSRSRPSVPRRTSRTSSEELPPISFEQINSNLQKLANLTVPGTARAKVVSIQGCNLNKDPAEGRFSVSSQRRTDWELRKIAQEKEELKVIANCDKVAQDLDEKQKKADELFSTKQKENLRIIADCKKQSTKLQELERETARVLAKHKVSQHIPRRPVFIDPDEVKVIPPAGAEVICFSSLKSQRDAKPIPLLIKEEVIEPLDLPVDPAELDEDEFGHVVDPLDSLYDVGGAKPAEEVEQAVVPEAGCSGIAATADNNPLPDIGRHTTEPVFEGELDLQLDESPTGSGRSTPETVRAESVEPREPAVDIAETGPPPTVGLPAPLSPLGTEDERQYMLRLMTKFKLNHTM